MASFEWPPTGGSGGTVTTLSVATANGFAGSVATPTTTPVITLSTTITGILQGNGTAISAATIGNLTDVGTDGITIGSGTGAVLGSGTTISQHVADSTHNGYLSSTDWTTFNGKQASGNYITALTGDVTATGPGSVAASLVATTNSTLTTLSALSSVDTITTGTWNATTIAVNHGGTGLTTLTANNVILGNGTGTPSFVAPSTSGNILTSNGTTWISSSASSAGSVTPVASTLLLRDASANGFVNILGMNSQQIAAAAGITTLTAASPAITTITNVGSNGQNIKTPNATTLSNGMTFYFYNYATGNCALLRADGSTFTTLKTNGAAIFQLLDNSTSNGTWAASISYYNTGSDLFIIGTIDTVTTTSDGLSLIGNTLRAQSATAAVPGMVNLTTQTFAGVKTFNSAPVMSGASITANTITNASRAQMAAHTMKGNNTGSTANEADLTLTQVRAEVYTVPTIQRFTSGSGTYTTPASCLRIVVQAIGGGGGGGGSGTVGGGTGTTGGDTTFGSSLITASGGVGGVFGVGAAPGAGGAATAGAATTIIAMAGNAGQGSGGAATAVFVMGGEGGTGVLGGSGSASSTGTGTAPQANSGAGGAGAGANGVLNGNGGAGGGAGGYVTAQISAPSATYAYGVGAKGTGGTAGTSGFAGTDGGSGIIIVTEYYV